MSDSTLHIIALSLIDGVGPLTIRRIVKYYGTVETCFNVSEKALTEIPGIGYEIASKIVQLREECLQRAERILKKCEATSTTITTVISEEYPLLLRACDDAPAVLYWKGSFLPEGDKILAVVGTRRPSDYGLRMCKKIIEDIAEISPVIVSGLADGIDTCAHSTSLKNSLATVAVLACGPDHIYPAHNRHLAEKVLENGALVSEFPPGTLPRKEFFPRRNRIIAGLARATVVIETAVDGGAMITARYAHDYGRPVFAIPARVTDESFSGTLKLIAEQMALVARDGNDILKSLGWERRRKEKEKGILPLDLTPEERTIYDFIRQKGEAHVDSILMALQLPAPVVLSSLLSLQFKGLVEELPGKKYVPAV